ncbi:NnrU family protein [Coralliovum pocilloporae]|uniref:NnrU family protein n=1 Tax=Coralliovum pocilloporae TaxID=3066369 RepID=UPI0033075781
MIEFVLSIVVFLAAHVLPRKLALRERLIPVIGRPAYMVLYSGLSLGLLVWIISAAARGPYIELWSFAVWQAWVPIAVMPVASILFFAGSLVPNPLSVGFRKGDANRIPSALGVLSRHPILWAFGLWALSHIPPNGDLISVLLFGSFAFFALMGSFGFDKRMQRLMGREAWLSAVSGAGAVPFIRVRGLKTASVLIGGSLGLIIYMGFMHGAHLWLIGADPVALVR